MWFFTVFGEIYSSEEISSLFFPSYTSFITLSSCLESVLLNFGEQITFSNAHSPRRGQSTFSKQKLPHFVMSMEVESSLPKLHLMNRLNIRNW